MQCEFKKTWKLTKSITNTLLTFINCCLRRIVGLKLYNKMTNGAYQKN